MNIEHKPYNPAPIRITRVHIGLNIMNKMNKQCSTCSTCSNGMNTANPVRARGVAKCSFVQLIEPSHE